MRPIIQKITSFFSNIKSIGYTLGMDDYERRRLGIFNLINFLGVVTGLSIPIAALSSNGYLPLIAWVVAWAPLLISSVVLISNYYKRFQFAMVWYFIMYPIITALVYAGGIDVGIELFFILYGVLAVFFLQNIRAILITVSFSIICYLFIYTLHGKYNYVMKDINYVFYFSNQFLSLFFIFLGLILIKKENSSYQFELTTINNTLLHTNEVLEKNEEALIEKTYLLEEQTEQLSELNTLKNRMFSIISHDLRNPIYSLRNLFRNVQEYNLPGEEVKVLLPDILNDLNYTTNLLDNLLQWAKSQMEGSTLNLQAIDVSKMIKETQNLLRLQAESKEVLLDSKVDTNVFMYGDKDMITLVLRNLLSNAIKFTPRKGKVFIGTSLQNNMVEIFVKDSGIGISKENIDKLFANNYFTTAGTANESGTGLGLMLCKEFLVKNGGNIYVESEEGNGSKFVFNVPCMQN
jgi:two-component system, sensor histidine kinase and response regulator